MEEVIDRGFWAEKEIPLSKQPDKKPGENGSKYILAGEGEGAITCAVSVNGDYLQVTGALHEVVTDALRELADVSAKHLEGKGKLDAKYTVITKRCRQSGKIRQWIEQADKKDRGVKRKAPDVSRAIEVIKLAKAAQEASNVSYALWPVSAKQRQQNLLNGPAPKRQKVVEEEDFGNHENNNNLYESTASPSKNELKRENQRLQNQLHRIQTLLINQNEVAWRQRLPERARTGGFDEQYAYLNAELTDLEKKSAILLAESKELAKPLDKK